MRRLVAETRVAVDDLVAPLFVKEGIAAPEPVASMPGVVQHTQESLRKEVRALADLGVPAVILFGIPAHKDATGSFDHIASQLYFRQAMAHLQDQQGWIRGFMHGAGAPASDVLAMIAVPNRCS